MNRFVLTGVAMLACALAGCANAPDTTAASRATPRYDSPEWGFSIDQPAGWQALHGFSGSYLANGAWKAFAGSASPGTPIVAIVMPGSNRITDAEVRIGASKAPTEVAACLQPPDAVQPGSVHRMTIGDTEFTTFEAGDAAMSHRMRVRAYRTVHDGACYAIDEVVFGTNPDVYDPPATPPFSDDAAFARMQPVIASLRFK